MATEFEALAKRCVTATGPDRELDAAIAGALGWQQLPEIYGPTARQWVSPENWESKSSFEGWVSDVDPPAFTGSIDAAMTLVPEGHDWILEHTNGGLTICCRVGHNDPDKNSWGETAVLALCAAALRARLLP